MQKPQKQVRGNGILISLRQLLFWPLRKVLALSLQYPLLLQRGTLIISRFPWLFNRLVAFAQAHGIVMAAEDANPDLDEIQSVSELSPQALQLFESLKTAYRKKSKAAQ